MKDIIYSRDVSGKEMAIYENGNIKQWNIWGTDNEGFIIAEGDKRYYLKDHLGSVRAVIDEGGLLVSAHDYDAWGYQLQDRSYNSEESKYKFTSKERDEENKYDYFGARYYDARVGRWGSIDPLLEKHYDFSSYNYVLDNPLIFYDPDGKQVFLGGESFQESKGIGQYIDVNETQLNSQRRFDNKRSRLSGLTTTDVGLLDPLEWIAGGFATISIRMAAKMTMTTSEILVEQTLKNIASNTTTETGIKSLVKSNGEPDINTIADKLSEFLGEGTKKIINEAGDVNFISKDNLRKVRFDINKFTPHNEPHIDMEK